MVNISIDPLNSTISLFLVIQFVRLNGAFAETKAKVDVCKHCNHDPKK